MRLFFVCAIIFFTAFAYAGDRNVDQQCPIVPPNKDLIKQNFTLAISAWLRGGANTKITNVRDFVCCMPEDMRENVTVAFASNSAQESHYHSSRIVIFNQETFLTFSLGNDPKLPQSENIEIMQNNRNRGNGTLELYDVDLSTGSPKLSARDPEKCMSCHGGNFENHKFGPHPIFGSDKVWGRFFGGTSTMCSEGMAQAINAAAKVVKETFDNKRLDCVNKKHLNTIDQPLPLQFMDNILKRHNANRIARIIRATPEYEKYKFLILGASLCVSARTVKTDYKMKISEWMPDTEIKKHTDLRFIDPSVRKARSADDAIDVNLQNEFLQNEVVERYLLDAAKKIKMGENPQFREYDGPVRCQKRKSFPAELKKIVKAEEQGISVFDKYVVDSHLRGTGAFNNFLTYEDSHQKMRPLMRFIFEGRGIDIGDWDMTAHVSSYKRDPMDMGFVFKALLDSEPVNSPVKKLSKFAHYSPPPDEVCDDLKQRSMTAFIKQSRATPTARPQSTDSRQ